VRAALKGDAMRRRQLGFIFPRCNGDRRGAQRGGDGQTGGGGCAGKCEGGDDGRWAELGRKCQDELGVLVGQFLKTKKEIKNPVGLHDALGRKMFWAV
jgi:hypothetical protein